MLTVSLGTLSVYCFHEAVKKLSKPALSEKFLILYGEVENKNFTSQQ